MKIIVKLMKFNALLKELEYILSVSRLIYRILHLHSWWDETDLYIFTRFSISVEIDMIYFPVAVLSDKMQSYNLNLFFITLVLADTEEEQLSFIIFLIWSFRYFYELGENWMERINNRVNNPENWLYIVLLEVKALWKYKILDCDFTDQ